MPTYKSTAKRRGIKSSKITYEEGSYNVFRDLGFSEEEATRKFLKCQLAITIEKIIKAKGWTQAQAAKKLGVAQPRISEIMTTQAHRFTLDMLIRYLSRLGKEIHLTVTDIGKTA